MTQSEGLSSRLMGNVKNKESCSQDNSIRVVIKMILYDLRDLYPNLNFGIDDKIMLRDIEGMVKKDGEYTTMDTTYIKPDGGFLWVEIKNKKYHILVSEQKRQGTNDRLLQENKKTQAKGNAAERLGKNVDGMDILFKDEEIYPFIVFLQGCDFHETESTIGDRIRTIAKFQKINQVNTHWIQIGKYLWCGGSYFMRGHSMYEAPGTSDWTHDEMYETMFTIAKTAINYYLEKYGK